MTRRKPAPKRLGRPQNVDSADTRDRLLEVARNAFATHGFDATTNKQIAEAAGITAGAIYHYFPSKAELYIAVYEQVQHVVYGAFEAAVAGSDTLVGRFSAALDAAVALNRIDPSIAGFVVGVASEAQRHPELMELLGPARRVGSSFLTRLVTDARDRGELYDDVDASALEDLLYAVLSGLARFSSQTNDAERHAAAVESLKRFFAGTLVRRPVIDATT